GQARGARAGPPDRGARAARQASPRRLPRLSASLRGVDGAWTPRGARTPDRPGGRGQYDTTASCDRVVPPYPDGRVRAVAGRGRPFLLLLRALVHAGGVQPLDRLHRPFARRGGGARQRHGHPVPPREERRGRGASVGELPCPRRLMPAKRVITCLG